MEGIPFCVDFIAIELGYALVQQLQAQHALCQAAIELGYAIVQQLQAQHAVNLQAPSSCVSMCGCALMQHLQAQHAVQEAAMQAPCA